MPEPVSVRGRFPVPAERAVTVRRSRSPAGGVDVGVGVEPWPFGPTLFESARGSDPAGASLPAGPGAVRSAVALDARLVADQDTARTEGVTVRAGVRGQLDQLPQRAALEVPAGKPEPVRVNLSSHPSSRNTCSIPGGLGGTGLPPLGCGRRALAMRPASSTGEVLRLSYRRRVGGVKRRRISESRAARTPAAACGYFYLAGPTAARAPLVASREHLSYVYYT